VISRPRRYRAGVRRESQSMCRPPESEERDKNRSKTPANTMKRAPRAIFSYAPPKT
jgi:hypothetical protein